MAMTFIEGDLGAMLLDVPVAEYLKSLYECDVYVTDDTLQNFNYGFIYSEGTSRDVIWALDILLFEVKESSEMQTLIKRHITVSPDTDFSGCLNEQQSLSMSQLGGLWIIIGTCLGTGLVWEISWIIYLRRRERKMRMEIEKAKEAAEKEGKVYKPPKKKSEAELKKEKFADILHSYLMVSDYIHIPSKNIHLHVEDDIKSRIHLVNWLDEWSREHR